MTKKLTILLSILTVLLVAVNGYLYLTKDRTAPVISFDDPALIWDEADGEEALLRDVKAVDNTDGDVTASIRIKSITLSDDQKSAVIVYYAKDSRHNIATASRTVSRKTITFSAVVTLT